MAVCQHKLLYLLIPLLILATLGCTGPGNLSFNPVTPGEYYTVGGRISLPEVVESGLLHSLRAEIAQVKDFGSFIVSIGDTGKNAEKDGKFRLEKVPFGHDAVLKAQSGKIALLRRIYPKEFYFTNVADLEISLDTTARALIWQAGKNDKKELTEADILAREYSDYVASVSWALKLALQAQTSSVPKTILDLEAVLKYSRAAAAIMEPKEEILMESWAVLRTILLNGDSTLFPHYISTSFSNDWDSSSDWKDITTYFKDKMDAYRVKNASYTISQIELLPGNIARLRTSGEIDYVHKISAIPGTTGVYSSDVIWKKEGSIWKVYQNLPYRSEHPATVGADARWGAIAQNHAKLKVALFKEDIVTFQSLISPNFGNDWDLNSTYADVLLTAQDRFNACDVKTAEYTIDSIEFIGNDLARVRCKASAVVIRLAAGIDIETDPIKAIVDWRREDGQWKIFRNLPYRFSHPRNIF